MRWLLVGTAPPPGGGGSLALARRARLLIEAGEEVVILSGDLRSAAQRHARLKGSLLGANLIWYGRRFDALELRLEPAVLGERAGRLASRRSIGALRVALGRFALVRLRLEHPLDERVFAPRLRSLLGSAAELVVGDEEDRSRVAATGLAVVCEPEPPALSRSSALEVLLGESSEIPPRRMLPMLVYERVRILGVLALRRALRH